MESVLLAINGSVHSLHATESIIRRMREGWSIALHVLHAEKIIPSRVTAYLNKDEILHFYEKETREHCALELKALEYLPIKPIWHLEIGEPAHCILDAANRFHVDSIVMGASGRSFLGTLMAGPVVAKVVKRATVPVVLVR